MGKGLFDLLSLADFLLLGWVWGRYFPVLRLPAAGGCDSGVRMGLGVLDFETRGKREWEWVVAEVSALGCQMWWLRSHLVVWQRAGNSGINSLNHLTKSDGACPSGKTVRWSGALHWGLEDFNFHLWSKHWLLWDTRIAKVCVKAGKE